MSWDIFLVVLCGFIVVFMIIGMLAYRLLVVEHQLKQQVVNLREQGRLERKRLVYLVGFWSWVFSQPYHMHMVRVGKNAFWISTSPPTSPQEYSAKAKDAIESLQKNKNWFSPEDVIGYIKRAYASGEGVSEDRVARLITEFERVVKSGKVDISKQQKERLERIKYVVNMNNHPV